MSKFVHLHTHSHYSLLDGLAKIDELISRAKELSMDALAITDHGALYGAIEFYKKAKKAGIKPILGVEAYIAPKSRFDKEPGEKYFHLTLLAENNAGWQNLIKLVTLANLEGFYYKPRMDREILQEHREGLIALSGCMSGEVSRAIRANNFDRAKELALEYQSIFGKGNYFLEIHNHPNIKEEAVVREGILALHKETGIPLVAAQDIHYVRSEDADYHDILVAVQTGNKLSDDDRLSLKADDFSMLSADAMYEKFKDTPEALTNTVAIADRCNVELTLGKPLLPDFPKPEGVTADNYLRDLAYKGFETRFSKEMRTDKAKERLEYELSVIGKTGFADYFLIVHDLVNWAKQHGIAVGPGRGSAAGSLVSYLLNVTDINPLEYNLLFERFLNPDRNEMPDIDIDFADTRRDEVLAYLTQKYGKDNVAQIITFGTMAARAGIRDAGRALGLSYGFCDTIAKLIPFGFKLPQAISQVPELRELNENDPNAKKLLDSASRLEGVARHASVHACGTVISKKPLTTYVPLQFAPQSKEHIITQFEMHSIEDLGLLKIDLLGLKNLTIIENTIRLVKELHEVTIDLTTLPLDDAKTFALLKKGDTTGVFQLEGSGMRRYLEQLKPTEFEDIIAMISLYRPGALDAGMVPRYIARKHGKEKIEYLLPELEPILKDTYGIVVYQEQLLQIARSLAGFTFSEADTLRKAVGKKIKALLDEQSEKFISGMIANGIQAKLAREIWNWFEPFARYGFNRSHAACYAMIAYRTAYLKAHYPEEFYASLFNSELNDIERISFLISESKKASIEVLPPDVSKSFVNFAPEDGKIRFGLQAIKNVGAHITYVIIQERNRGGPFKDLHDFLRRVQDKDLNKKSLESLIKSGALDSFGIERNKAYANLDEMIKFTSSLRKSTNENQHSLFGKGHDSLRLTLKDAPPLTEEEKLRWEKELLGLYISSHPLNRFAPKIKEAKAQPLSEAGKVTNERIMLCVAGTISRINRVMTKKGDPMLFATIEDFSPETLEVIVFNSTLAKTNAVWEENMPVLIYGRMSKRNGETKLICESAKRLEEA